MPEDSTPPAGQKRLIEQKATDAALEAALSSLVVNRFEVLPYIDGRDGVVLVLGTILAGTNDTHGEVKSFVEVRMHGAHAISRAIGADIAAKLASSLQLSEEEWKQAMDKYSSDHGTDG